MANQATVHFSANASPGLRLAAQMMDRPATADSIIPRDPTTTGRGSSFSA